MRARLIAIELVGHVDEVRHPVGEVDEALGLERGGTEWCVGGGAGPGRLGREVVGDGRLGGPHRQAGPEGSTYPTYSTTVRKPIRS